MLADTAVEQSNITIKGRCFIYPIFCYAAYALEAVIRLDQG